LCIPGKAVVNFIKAGAKHPCLDFMSHSNHDYSFPVLFAVHGANQSQIRLLFWSFSLKSYCTKISEEAPKTEIGLHFDFELSKVQVNTLEFVSP
jgi:hypothetical protein